MMSRYKKIKIEAAEPEMSFLIPRILLQPGAYITHNATLQTSSLQTQLMLTETFLVPPPEGKSPAPK